MGSLGKLYVTLNARTTQFARQMTRAQWLLRRFGNRADQVGRKMRRLGIAFSLAFTTPIVAASALSVKSFAKFEEAMRNVNTIAQQTEVQFKATGQAVLKMAPLLGREPVGLATALYNINSASFKGAEGLSILRASAVAGVAGLASTGEAAKAIVGVLNAYSLSADQATDASDIMFRTVEKGLLTFGEMSEHLGAVLATASAAGIAFEEIAAAAASMTRGVIGPAEAFISLNRMIMRMIKGNEELNALFKKTEAGSARVMLATEGLGAVMQFITKETKGEAGALMHLGFMLRDLKAAQSLSRSEGKEFAKDLLAIAIKANRAGATLRAFKEQTKALSFQLKILRSMLKVLSISFGRELAVPLRALVGYLQKVVSWMVALPPSAKRALLVFAGFVAAIGPALILLGSFLISIKILALTAAMTLSPLNWIIAAFGALAAVSFLNRIRFKSMADFLSYLEGVFVGFVTKIKQQFIPAVEKVTGVWDDMFDVIEQGIAKLTKWDFLAVVKMGDLPGSVQSMEEAYDNVIHKQRSVSVEGKKMGDSLVGVVSSFIRFGLRVGDTLLNIVKTWRLMTDESKKLVVNSLKIMLAAFVLWKVGVIQAVAYGALSIISFLIPAIVKATAAMLVFVATTWQGRIALAGLLVAFAGFRLGKLIGETLNFSSFLLKLYASLTSFGNVVITAFTDYMGWVKDFAIDFWSVLKSAFTGELPVMDLTKYKDRFTRNTEDLWDEVDALEKRFAEIDKYDKSVGLGTFKERAEKSFEEALKMPGEGLLDNFSKIIEEIPGMLNKIGIQGWKQLIQGFKGGKSDLLTTIQQMLSGVWTEILAGFPILGIKAIADQAGKGVLGGKTDENTSGAGAAVERGTVAAFEAEQTAGRSARTLVKIQEINKAQLVEDKKQTKWQEAMSKWIENTGALFPQPVTLS